MPEHSSWLMLLLAQFRDNLAHNADALGAALLSKREPTWESFEPIAAAVFVALLLIVLGALTRARLAQSDGALVPDEKLTLRTFMETFLGYFYDLAKSVMGPERAKRYFPFIGTAALFVFTSNVFALVPGWPVATSNLNITFGSAVVVFIAFNFYGLKVQGWDYIKHLAGPSLALAILVFPIEVISLIVRPITLSVRLMLNMAADHLIVTIFLGALPLVLPLPVMLLECLVIVIQTLVFTLLTCIYIGLATEDEAH